MLAAFIKRCGRANTVGGSRTAPTVREHDWCASWSDRATISVIWGGSGVDTTWGSLQQHGSQGGYRPRRSKYAPIRRAVIPPIPETEGDFPHGRFACCF